MKVVFLAAGKGRRLLNDIDCPHKSLVSIGDQTLLENLIECCLFADIKDFLVLVGHSKDHIVEEFNKTYTSEFQVYFVENRLFDQTNNLYSLFCAKDILQGEEFLLINADLVADKRIIKGILMDSAQSSIALDCSRKSPIDSPGSIVKGNRILDLGRHINFKDSEGFAIGIYKFGSKLSSIFFKEAEKLLEKDKNAGFHDPLCSLFTKVLINPYRIGNLKWTDIDVYSDIEKAKNIQIEIKLDQDDSSNL